VHLLKTSDIIAFVGVRDAGAARTFYRDTLGLTLVSEDRFALVFDANGTMLRVTLVPEVRSANYTVLGWQVSDIVATAKLLNAAGVELQRYPGLNDRDELGIWTAPGGARIAWFKDPDGNVLSITQF
jgi:catechol 2,3-dioxygenase-like lactoylglutathione lyase family enzyme